MLILWILHNKAPQNRLNCRSGYVLPEDISGQERGSAAAACSLYERVAVGTLRHSGVSLVSTHCNAVERTVVFSDHVMLTLSYGTLDVIIFLFVFHFQHLLGYLFYQFARDRLSVNRCPYYYTNTQYYSLEMTLFKALRLLWESS